MPGRSLAGPRRPARRLSRDQPEYVDDCDQYPSKGLEIDLSGSISGYLEVKQGGLQG